MGGSRRRRMFSTGPEAMRTCRSVLNIPKLTCIVLVAISSSGAELGACQYQNERGEGDKKEE